MDRQYHGSSRCTVWEGKAVTLLNVIRGEKIDYLNFRHFSVPFCVAQVRPSLALPPSINQGGRRHGFNAMRRPGRDPLGLYGRPRCRQNTGL